MPISAPNYLSNQTAGGGGVGSAARLHRAGRRAPAFCSFGPSVEVTESRSGARLRGYMTDLGTQGCYVQTSNPFPVGTLVRLRLVNGRGSLETAARVCHSQPTLGMGLAFLELKFDQLIALEGWVGPLK
jgi:hypothetical protein